MTASLTSNYNANSTITTFVITSGTPITITATSPTTITYSGTVPSLTYTTSSPYAFSTPPTCSIYASSDTTFATPITLNTSTNAGTYVVHCSGAVAAAEYSIGSYVDGSFTINRASQATLSLSISPNSKIYPYSETIVPTPEGGSGDGLTRYEITGGSASDCSLSGSNVLTSTSTGTCFIRAKKHSQLITTKL